jgi:hypothetical protein
MAIPVFSNKPKFCTQQLSLAQCLSLAKFNALTQSAMENPGLNAYATACGDPNLATTFRKNIIHQVIRCGGKMIDLNFMMDIFGKADRMVDTKQFYNHYICDTNMNIYSGATYTSAGPGLPVTWQVLKSNHGSSGTQSLPAVGFSVWDKDNMIEYIVNGVDISTPYAHKITMTPTDITVTATIKQNTPYLVVPARRVGGNTCQQITNTMSTIGYSQQLGFLRVRRDWCVEIELLKGYQDKIQYAVIYDIQGNPMDSWDVAEAQEARQGVRMALNMAAWIGTPTTNTQLIQNQGAVADPYYLGFYGLIPSIKYGNGIVYDFRASTGFDLEADGEPIFLYQDSQKRTSKFLVMHGLGFKFALNNRGNKMVARSGTNLAWEGYKRVGALSPDTNETEVAKLGIQGYSYEGFELDMKRVSAMSDARYAGSDYYSNMGVMIPQDGPMENGRQIDPIEFYQEGQGNWTGGYEEHYVDNRNMTSACETIQGWSAQSMGMAVHCPDLLALLNPVVDA